MKTNRRSQKHRADKYSRRAAVMLEQFHWEKAESHFLALMETAVLTIEEIRELTWAQVRTSYEGIVILDRVIPLKEEYLESMRSVLETRIGFYGEDLNSSDGSPRLFSKESLKVITKELDQFKE
ncbi:hypothetical protein EXM22_12870 [Oceanispirochaeta crateris]|uniref:Uncharacterized protein n=1 Tax=Oceanispirochaeta crateris TaxID=2518645 RepID=A0A5C1QPB8_9SPIO|nr:hypothetical protein [Oceanispirochaeta crateris]QEN08840.1 hypothetical protein EXM22_12870 [Oceanispirochaeta crateris]